jgi:hypothetical protein
VSKEVILVTVQQVICGKRLSVAKQQQKSQSDLKAERRMNFLRSVADEHHGTLKPGVAVVRLELLLDDINRLSGLMTLAPEPETHADRLPPEIVSYYAVGFITCLEWHARSRLSDLFTYMPKVVTDDDLAQGGGMKTIAHLIREGASIPQYLAAIPNYSTPEAYIRVFDRVFNALSLNPSPRELLNKNGGAKVLGYEGGSTCLDALYDIRNMLVHEINQSHVGHPIIRDGWTCEQAQQFGRFVLELMSNIESLITLDAPANFPNRLVWGSAPESLEAVLDREIESLENELAIKIEGFEDVRALTLKARDAEDELIQECLPHLRWYDTKCAPRCALRQGRLRYLQALKNELGDAEGVDEFANPYVK